MRQVKLLCPLRVTPFDAPPPPPGQDADLNAKQLVFEDAETGEILLYQMSGDMAKKIGGKLKMNNKALADELAREQADAIARATIAGPPGNGLLGPGGQPLT